MTVHDHILIYSKDVLRWSDLFTVPQQISRHGSMSDATNRADASSLDLWHQPSPDNYLQQQQRVRMSATVQIIVRR